jgi:hypothetical protein
MRLRMPIKQRGAVAQRWARWHERSRSAVMRRCNFACEGCGQRMRPLEWHHLVGRNAKGIGEPWCSTPELTVGLCSSGYGQLGCHQGIDRGLMGVLQTDLRYMALERFLGVYEITGFYPYALGLSPLDAIREAARRLDGSGWVFDAVRAEIVKL